MRSGGHDIARLLPHFGPLHASLFSPRVPRVLPARLQRLHAHDGQPNRRTPSIVNRMKAAW